MLSFALLGLQGAVAMAEVGCLEATLMSPGAEEPRLSI